MNMQAVVDLLIVDPQVLAWTADVAEKRDAIEAKVTVALPKIITSYDFPFVMRTGTDGVTVADTARYQLKGLADDCRDVQDVLYDVDETTLDEISETDYRDKYAGTSKPSSVVEWYPDGEINGFPAIVLVGTPGVAGTTFKYPYRRKTMPVAEFPEEWMFVLLSCALYELFGKGAYSATYDKMMGDLSQMIDDYDRGGTTPQPARMDSDWKKRNRERNALHGYS